ncbi:DUF4383 domain-containing protein [Candidatus Parcubacteria bacterium]|nr:DUF4383 domain-containing protein [Candidatus Parcubacteria bacterium]
MAKKFALVFGWIFVVFGVLGFFSNPIISGAPGAIFMADTAHNIVHLISGVIFLWVAYGAVHKSAMVLKVFGVVYLLMAVVGFFSGDSVLGLITVNGADNWLNLVLAALFLWGGMSRDSSPSMAMGQM